MLQGMFRCAAFYWLLWVLYLTGVKDALGERAFEHLRLPPVTKKQRSSSSSSSLKNHLGFFYITSS